MNEVKLLRAIREAYPEGLLSGVDQIWYADTSLCPRIEFWNLTHDLCPRG